MIAEEDIQLFMFFPPFYMLSSYSMVKIKICDDINPYLLHENDFFVIIINCMGG